MNGKYDSMIHPTRPMVQFCPSVYGNKAQMHACDLPDAVSVNVSDLFPTMPKALYSNDGDDLSIIDGLTRKAMENVDLSSIRPGESVNILTCEHGFLMMGGRPYVEMVKAMKQVIEERTGAYDIRVDGR